MTPVCSSALTVVASTRCLFVTACIKPAQGSVAKITGKEGLQFRGPARVFDSEEDMIAVVNDDPQKLKVTEPSIPLLWLRGAAGRGVTCWLCARVTAHSQC